MKKQRPSHRPGGKTTATRTPCCAALLIAWAACASSVAQLADTPWPTFKHDMRRTSRSPSVGPATADVKWTCHIRASMHSSSPALALDGTIYGGAEDGNLYAVNPDGTIYFVFEDSHVYALQDAGDHYVFLWSYRVELPYQSGAKPVGRAISAASDLPVRRFDAPDRGAPDCYEQGMSSRPPARGIVF